MDYKELKMKTENVILHNRIKGLDEKNKSAVDIMEQYKKNLQLLEDLKNKLENENQELKSEKEFWKANYESIPKFIRNLFGTKKFLNEKN